MERALQGVRVVTEFVQDGSTPSQSSTLFAEGRSRPGIESTGNAYDIQRRDMRKTFRVFVKRRRYQEIPIFDLLSPEEIAAFTRSGRHWNARHIPAERTISRDHRILLNYEKTQGEAVMFNCLARKWRTIHREERTQGGLTNSTETVSEVWYLDIDQTIDRYPGLFAELIRQDLCFMTSTTNGEYPSVAVRGEAPAGLCVRSEGKTMRRLELPTGEIREQRHVRFSRILALNEEKFAESLFEPPSGFRKMPVYPSRITMARLDAARGLRHIGARLQSIRFRRVA